VKVGDVFRVHTTLTSPPKKKIVLHVGGGLFLWFNSDPRRSRPAQMQVGSGEVPGISHACFLDCGRVTVFTALELQEAEYCGHASDVFMLRVAEEVEFRATTLTMGQRKTVGSALRQPIE
jgi:hypothetical protein